MLKATDGYCWVSFPTVGKSSVPVALFSHPHHGNEWEERWAHDICRVSKWHSRSEIWKQAHCCRTKEITELQFNSNLAIQLNLQHDILWCVCIFYL